MNISHEGIIAEEDILRYLKEENPKFSETALKWGMQHYIKENSLVRVGVKKFVQNGRIYSYEYKSELTLSIDGFLEKYYPDVKTVIWESRQLNEWLNLLIATNIIYVEVEKDCVDYVFSSLNERYGNENIILLNPDEELISRYLKNDLVIVKTLYSKSPTSRKKRKILLEKLVVDVLAGDFSLDTRGIEDVVQGIRDTYDIDIDKALAYASRRRIKEKLLEMWGLKND